ncbi:MAG: energy-coupling factor transporter transmembrane component T [Bacilli bacterium]
MNDKMIFGQYYHSDSWIHRLDPRTKIITLFGMMLTAFIFASVWGLVGMFVVVMILIATSKIPIGKFLQSLRMMAMLLVFTIFFQVFFSQGIGDPRVTLTFELRWLSVGLIVGLLGLFFLSKKWFRKGRILLLIALVGVGFYLQTVITTTSLLTAYTIRIYDEGLITSARVILRIVNLICFSSLLTLTTKPTDLNNGLESVAKPLKVVKINVSIMAMMISIALRFIPTLINEAMRILKAQASRGVDFAEGKIKDKIMQIISLLIPMFVVAYKRAEDLANAMEARGYIPGAPRSKINELLYRRNDILAYSFGFLFLGLAIFLRIAYAI